MNTRWIRFSLALLFAVVVMVTAATPGTYAFVSEKSNTLRNSFNVPTSEEPQAAQVQVNVMKIVTSTGKETISPEGFRFALLDTATGVSHTLVADKHGHASATLTIADTGRAYTYRLTEIDDGRERVTYSTETYDITITPAVDANNCIVPMIAVNGVATGRIDLCFENIYDPAPEIPVTGDNSGLMLYAMLLLLSSAALGGCVIYRRRIQ